MSDSRRRVRKVFSKPSLTQQSFKQECDLNVLMSRFKKNCGVDYLTRYNGYMSGQFGDFSEVVDYRSALEQLQKAEEVFMSMPAKARAYFQNDCALFLDALHDSSRVEELQGVGILQKPLVTAKSEAEPQ